MSTGTPTQTTSDHSADPSVGVITVTDEALTRILELREQEDDAEGLALWLEVSGLTTGGTDYAYDMFFEPLDRLPADMNVHRHGALPVAVPPQDVPKLQGATLDLPAHADQAGLTLRNPNRPNPFVGEHGAAPELEGTVDARIRQLLDQQINPAIAAHGGHAELVTVEDEAAYIRLSGGCQGCAMSRVTVTQGIETAILSQVPEVTRVVDVTDHAEGANPYYEEPA